MNPNVFKIPQLLVNVTTILFLMVLLHDAESCTVKHTSLYNHRSKGYVHVANDTRGTIKANSDCVYTLDIITFEMTRINGTRNVMKMFIFDPRTKKFICTDRKNRLVSRRRIKPHNRKMCEFTYEPISTAYVQYRPLRSKKFISFNKNGLQTSPIKQKFNKSIRYSTWFLDKEVKNTTTNMCHSSSANSNNTIESKPKLNTLEYVRHQHQLCK